MSREYSTCHFKHLPAFQASSMTCAHLVVIPIVSEMLNPLPPACLLDTSITQRPTSCTCGVARRHKEPLPAINYLMLGHNLVMVRGGEHRRTTGLIAGWAHKQYRRSDEGADSIVRHSCLV